MKNFIIRFLNILVFNFEMNYFCMIFDFLIDGDYYVIVMIFVIDNVNVMYYILFFGCDLGWLDLFKL